MKEDKQFFSALKVIHNPNWIRIFAILLMVSFFFLIFLLQITPWQQTSQGSGRVIAFDPNDRVQVINSNMPGRVSKWFVSDGSKVKKGDPIVEILDNDPRFIERLEIERDAIFQKYRAAKAASETSLLNYKRQKDLHNQGLSARTKLEKAKIEYKKLLSGEAMSAANLAKAEVNLSRQQNQIITAPRDGTVLRVLHGTGSIFVKTGDVLASFVPDSLKPAVEIFINGNDLPLVFPGRHVRLQFEGWPAVQFSGWPAVAIGTFGGVVSIVDPSASKNGKFRVVVEPAEDEQWPKGNFLRPGTRSYGWVLLDEVKLGYEIWRKFNGFPASMESAPDTMEQFKTSVGDKKKKEKKSYYKNLYKDK